ncbi:MAG: FecR domain-containing protein [Bacteroidota bacterium]
MLLIRRLKGEMTAAEERELQQWMKQSEANRQIANEFLKNDSLKEGIKDLMQKEVIWERIQEQTMLKAGKVIRVNWYKRIAIAASIFLVFGLGAYFAFFNKRDRKQGNAVTKTTDINPGGYKARLILSDGRSIILDSAVAGRLTQQGNTAVLNKNNQLVYESSGHSGSVQYNTLATGQGEMYSLALADGTKVWLNSESSIYFPVTFTGKERRIEVTGEVYVQVAKNPSLPFIASANGLEVLALGTEFNINSYKDEDDISATLVEGSVKVTNGATNTILHPGQQTKLTRTGELTPPAAINTDEVTGWRDGWFHFESADLKTILRQFARWYDVEVVYEGPVKNRKFFGIVKRSSSLSTVLEMLQDNDIIFRIEGKKLIVKSG